MPKAGREADLIRIRHMLEFALKAIGLNSGKDRAEWESNETLALATVHLVEMVGEACRTVSIELRSQYPQVPWDQISGTRNRLAHGYIDVDLDIIWTIVTRDLPLLVAQLELILCGEGG